jgi:hypothetical protein
MDVPDGDRAPLHLFSAFPSRSRAASLSLSSSSLWRPVRSLDVRMRELLSFLAREKASQAVKSLSARVPARAESVPRPFRRFLFYAVSPSRAHNHPHSCTDISSVCAEQNAGTTAPL